jgi:Malectin domain/Glycosyl hydrolases family 16
VPDIATSRRRILSRWPWAVAGLVAALVGALLLSPAAGAVRPHGSPAGQGGAVGGPAHADAAPAAEQSFYRMNAGGPQVTDSIGRTWVADQHFIGGHPHTVTETIAGTADQSLFRSERWGMSGYDIPAVNGSYTLQLLFAEINPTSGARVFSVTVNGRMALRDYSIGDHVGAFRSAVERIPVTITDGVLRIRFAARVNSASIAGIEVLTAAPGPTPPGPDPTATPTQPTPTQPTQPPPTQPTPTGPPSQTVPPAPADPSGQPMPTGDLPGWRQVFTDNFGTAAPLGSFPGSAYGSKWSAYQEGWPDTTGHGRYSPGRTLSTHGGMLDIDLHTENGVHLVAAPVPKLPNGAFGQTYGRYTVRFRADPVAGYKTAWLLWPDSDNWDEGELDFPEGNLDAHILGFAHHRGNPHEQDAFSTQAGYGSWHTATTEWTPGRVTYLLDGVTVGTSTTAVPNTPMHYVLQTETCTDSGCAPSNAAAGHVQIDWVAIYART